MLLLWNLNFSNRFSLDLPKVKNRLICLLLGLKYGYCDKLIYLFIHSMSISDSNFHINTTTINYATNKI